MIDIICGARPNFMKVDPIIRNLPDEKRIRLVHTGQHYDHKMSASFFDELELPRPDVNLNVGSASISVQTAHIMERYESVFMEEPPEAVVVVGDVNSTLACALVAVRHCTPVVHVEAGLRSFDRRMPEEINRILTDQITDLLLITSKEAKDNLLAEGRDSKNIVMVGNPMIDTLFRLLPIARAKQIVVPEEPFALITLHRPSNVDTPERLRDIFDALGRIEDMKLLFPAHPRTIRNIEKWSLQKFVPHNLFITEPMSYLTFIYHQENADVVITDSGGIQEETSVLGIPCVTVRENTERPVTLELGTSVLCPEPSEIPIAVAAQIQTRPETPAEIEMWDGKAGVRIAKEIIQLTEEDR